MDSLNLLTLVFGVQIQILGQKTDNISDLDISGINYDGNYQNQSLTSGDHGKG